MGSIEQLGNWSDFVCPMHWTEGHIWVTDPILLTQHTFQYKYVLKESNGHTIWESGYDRLADLRLLPNQDDSATGYEDNAQTHQETKISLKTVAIQDEWETYLVKFQVNCELDSPVNSKQAGD